MDVSGCVPDARPRKRARRVQPDSDRLQLAPRAQCRRRQADDRRGPALKVAGRRAQSAATSPQRLLRVDTGPVAAKRSRKNPSAIAQMGKAINASSFRTVCQYPTRVLPTRLSGRTFADQPSARKVGPKGRLPLVQVFEAGARILKGETRGRLVV